MTKKRNSKYVTVYRMNIAMDLIKMGHKVVSTIPNPKRPDFSVWIFERDETFTEDFDRLLGKE